MRFFDEKKKRFIFAEINVVKMMKNFKLCVAIGLLLMVCACSTSYKQVPYLQNSDTLDPTVAIDLFAAIPVRILIAPST